MDAAKTHDSILTDFVAVMRRRWRLVAAVTILAPLIGVLFSLTQTKLYESKAEILLSRQNIAALVTRTPSASLSQADFQRVLETEAAVARTPEIAARVTQVVNPKQSPSSLLSRSTVTAQPNVDVLSFAVRDEDPARAQRLATEYARQYQGYRTRVDTDGIAQSQAQVESQLAELRKRGATASPTYLDLISQLAQLRTLDRVQRPASSLLNAGGDAVKVQPRPLRLALIGLVIGLVLGIALAFGREALDTRIRSREELSDKLGLPLLGTIPEPPRRLRRENRLVTLAEADGSHAEAFRMLRTSLDFTNLEVGARTIMVTSALEREGKSTTAANLAVSLARRRWRVTLVDFDLRRPFVHRFFGLEAEPGLTDVALGSVDLDDAVHKVSVPVPALDQDGPAEERMLNVLTVGSPAGDVSDFLSTPFVARVLRELRETSDIVILDTPPLLQVGDALSLSNRVDGMILVVRLNVLRSAMVRELTRALDQAPAAKLGYVVTGADADLGYGDMGRYYYSSTRSPGKREKQARTP